MTRITLKLKITKINIRFKLGPMVKNTQILEAVLVFSQPFWLRAQFTSMIWLKREETGERVPSKHITTCIKEHFQQIQYAV